MPEQSLSKELTTIRTLLSAESRSDRQEWHNAYKAYNDELEHLRQQLPEEWREVVQYVAQRELALTLRDFVTQLKSEAAQLRPVASTSKRVAG